MLDRGKPFPGEKAGSTDPSGLNRTTFRNSVSPARRIGDHFCKGGIQVSTPIFRDPNAEGAKEWSSAGRVEPRCQAESWIERTCRSHSDQRRHRLSIKSRQPL